MNNRTTFGNDSKQAAETSYKNFLKTGSARLVYQPHDLLKELKLGAPSGVAATASPKLSKHIKHGVVEAIIHAGSHVLDHHVADGLGRKYLLPKAVAVVEVVDTYKYLTTAKDKNENMVCATLGAATKVTLNVGGNIGVGVAVAATGIPSGGTSFALSMLGSATVSAISESAGNLVKGACEKVSESGIFAQTSSAPVLQTTPVLVSPSNRKLL